MDKAAIVRVRLTPGGGRNALMRCEDDLLHARVAAPPVEGAANKALIVLLAETLDVPKSRIALASGAMSRDKTLHIEGLDTQTLWQRLDAALAR